MLQQTDRSRLAVPSLFEDGGIRLAIFRDINLELIFTSQLDANNMACWKNTAPRLLTGASKLLRQGRVFILSVGDGDCPKVKALCWDTGLWHTTVTSPPHPHLSQRQAEERQACPE